MYGGWMSRKEKIDRVLLVKLKASNKSRDLGRLKFKDTPYIYYKFIAILLFY